MSNLVRFEKVDNELNILRIGGKSFLPPDVEWPTNPNGEKMVFIFNILTRRNEMGQAAQVIAYMDKERPWEAAMEYNALGQETSRLVSGSVYSSWEY